eukprot:15478888-Alexandrium_andersonii.AAC.1
MGESKCGFTWRSGRHPHSRGRLACSASELMDTALKKVAYSQACLLCHGEQMHQYLRQETLLRNYCDCDCAATRA